MSKYELATQLDNTLEEELDMILERYHLLSWKELILEVLIENTQKEKKNWEASNYEEDSNSKRVINDLNRVIEIAETLKETEAA